MNEMFLLVILGGVAWVICRRKLFGRWWFALALAALCQPAEAQTSSTAYVSLTYDQDSFIARGPGAAKAIGYYHLVGTTPVSSQTITGQLHGFEGYWMATWSVGHVGASGVEDVHRVGVKIWMDDQGTVHASIFWDGDEQQEVYAFQEGSAIPANALFVDARALRLNSRVGSGDLSVSRWFAPAGTVADGSAGSVAGQVGIQVSGLDRLGATATTQPATTQWATTVPTTQSWLADWTDIMLGKKPEETSDHNAREGGFFDAAKAAAASSDRPWYQNMHAWRDLDETAAASSPQQVLLYVQDVMGAWGIPDDISAYGESGSTNYFTTLTGAEKPSGLFYVFASAWATVQTGTLGWFFGICRTLLSVLFGVWFISRVVVSTWRALGLTKEGSERIEEPFTPDMGDVVCGGKE